MLLPQGRGWIVQNTPRERACPSSGDLCPRHALASDPLPLPPLLVAAGFKRANLPLSFSLAPYTMIPLSVGEVKSCLCGCCWQTPSLEAASNHTPACFTLGLQLPGFTEKSYFSKEPVFKEELCVSDWPGTRGQRAHCSLPASSSPALGCGNSRWLPAEPGD